MVEDEKPVVAPTQLDTFERIAKIVSLAAIPIVIPIALAVYSAKVQGSAQKEAINRDYVELSVSILKEKKENVDPDLRDWAVDLLADHSPTRFSPAVVTALKSGRIFLPGNSGNQAAPIVALSADLKYLALATSRSYSVFDVQNKTMLFVADTDAAPSALDFSPDGKILAVGFVEGSVLVSEVVGRRLVLNLRTDQTVASIRYTSGAIFVVSLGGTIRVFALPSGKLLKQIETRVNAPALTVKVQ